MVLGIDPGIANTGWAVVDVDKLIDCGCIVTKTENELEKRFDEIIKELDNIFGKYNIDEVAIETLYFNKNIKSAMKVSEMIGLLKCWALNKKIKIFEYTPLQIKSSLVGYGRAQKSQVELMVRVILGLNENIRPSHASDAVAVAITHLQWFRV